MPDLSYRGGHTAPVNPEYHAPLYNMNKVYPDDIYSSLAIRYYGHGGTEDIESFNIINKVKDKPDADVTIYRAISGDAPNDINPGDWVTTSKEYAKLHAEGLDNGKIVKAKVKAKQLYTDGNSPLEYGYSGKASTQGMGVAAGLGLAGSAIQKGLGEIPRDIANYTSDIAAYSPAGLIVEGANAYGSMAANAMGKGEEYQQNIGQYVDSQLAPKSIQFKKMDDAILDAISKGVITYENVMQYFNNNQ